jgi:hypothetical protein
MRYVVFWCRTKMIQRNILPLKISFGLRNQSLFCFFRVRNLSN